MRFLLAALLLLQPAAGTLRVTVVDQTNAIVVGATVTVTPTEGAAAAAAAPPVKTNEAGVAVIPALAPGRYAIQAEFPGFEKRILADVRIRAGENRQVAILTIQKLETAVTVEQDKQQAASDRNGPSFGTTLTRDQIDALSDDPSILQQQLQDMAGPGAVIRIDGFEGGALPPKAMIRSIRIAAINLPRSFTAPAAYRSKSSRNRVSARYPSLLILDEATAALDGKSEAELIGRVKKMAPLPAALVVAHRQSTLSHCDFVASIRHGVVS